MRPVTNRRAFTALAILALTIGILLAAGCSGSPRSVPVRDVDLMMGVRDVDMMLEVTEADDMPFWVLVVGNDSREGTVEISRPEYADGYGRADTIMLVRVDPQTYQLGIVTVSRDTATATETSRTKLNDFYYNYGIEGLAEQIRLLTGVEAKYYLDTDFRQFENLVDALGGVTAIVPIDMQLTDIVSGDWIELGAGEQALNGPQALVLARSRKQYNNDLDACRQIQDRQVLANLILQVAAHPAEVAESVQALLDNTDTNWPKAKMLRTVGDFAAHADQITIISGTGPYDGGIDEETQLWLADRDEGTWTSIIETVEAGGDPTAIIPLPVVLPLQQ